MLPRSGVLYGGRWLSRHQLSENFAQRPMVAWAARSLPAFSSLLVVGAEYSLETGVVEFFDGVPAGA